ncbi:MAG: carbon storage regulator [Holosporales bacterium]|jgi:carbon storage regulator
MLYITRKPGESLRIGDNITIVVEEVRGNSVKFSITSPPSVQVLRGEIYDRIGQENIASTQSAAALFAQFIGDKPS